MPAVVLHANRVVARSPAAAAEGVAIGQRRRSAQQRCPDVVLLDHDPDRDARAFEPVVRAVARFTPRVEVVEPGWLCLDARGPSRYFGGDERFAEHLVAAVTESVARATTSVTDAGSGRDRRRALRLGRRRPPGAAGGASSTPGGVGRVPRRRCRWPGCTRSARSTPSWSGCSPASAWPASASWPRCRPATCWPGSGRRAATPTAWPAAATTGRADAVEPPPERRVEQTFDDPVVQLEPLVFVGKHLADELVAGLAAEGRVCTRLVVTAETEHGERSERVWYRAAGMSAPAMVERVRWQLEGWMEGDDITAGVVLLRLAPAEVRGDDGDQLRLWGGPSAADERAARTVSRLAGMVGDEGVLVPAWRGGRLPGDRYGWVPASTTDLTDADDTAERLRPPSPVRGRASLPAPSPAVVPPASQPAELADAAGRPVRVGGRGELSAPPATLAIAGRPPVAVTGWAGPWPVDERWWEPHRHRRLARFQVVTADGAAHLVLAEHRHWWVAASYE